MRQHRKKRLDPGELTSGSSGTFNKTEKKKKNIYISSPAYALIQEKKRLQVKTKRKERRGRIKWEAQQLSYLLAPQESCIKRGRSANRGQEAGSLSAVCLGTRRVLLWA